MSTGLACERGGGFQHWCSRSITSLMLSSGSATAGTGKASSAAANHKAGLPRRPTSSSLDVGGDLHLDHLVRIGRWLALVDLVDDVHALHDVPDHGVLAVEERGVGKADEELRVGGIDAVAAPGHADHAALERRGGKLLLQHWIFRAAGAVEFFTVAGLRHEAVDDAVERHVVVEAVARELLDARGMPGREVGP